MTVCVEPLARRAQGSGRRWLCGQLRAPLLVHVPGQGPLLKTEVEPSVCVGSVTSLSAAVVTTCRPLPGLGLVTLDAARGREQEPLALAGDPAPVAKAPLPAAWGRPGGREAGDISMG